MNQSIRTIVSCAFFALLFCLGGWAQSVSINLGEQPQGAQSKVDVTYSGVNFKYIFSATTPGAYIYRNDIVYGDYSLTISSEKNIVAIEFEGRRSSTKGKTADLAETTGNGVLTFTETETSKWEGSAKKVRFAGASPSTGYTIERLRLWLEGDSGETGEDVDVLQRPGADVHYYAQGHNLPYDGRPVTLAVVSHSKFRAALQDYLVWKTQQGYHVEELYADEISMATGKTLDNLALEIRERLMALDPQPSYVLLAGDEDEVPYFEPRTAMAGGQDAVTDFFYGEYSSDYFPDAAVGRFSATTVEQLKAQMDKTKYMAFINPANADWLKHSFIAHAPSYDISTEKGAKFGVDFPQKFKGNTSRSAYPTSTGNEINAGCSFVAYLGHGSVNSWQGYGSGDVAQLANKNMYPVVLGLTCLSGSFQFYECMGEAFMRQKDAGAVAFIGATRESWDGADNLFFMGGSSNHESFEHAGFLRSLFHPDEEDASQITRTIGDAFNMGKFACRFLGEYKPWRQFSEFFTLFGDPTYQPYITVPKQMTITAPKSVVAGRCVSIETAPDAVVCISEGRKVIAVGLADSKGHISLKVPADAPTGVHTLYSSAPFYNDLASTININPGDGTEDKGDIEEKTPRVQYRDVVDIKSAAQALPGKTKEYLGYQPASFSVGSPARYTLWAGTNLTAGKTETQYQDWLTTPNDVIRGIYLRNKYECSSFITTATGGKAAYVEVDWLNPIGQAEILGVYGSKTPYTDTRQAWNGNAGEKLGTLRKGDNNRLDITGNWPYILVRAEDYEGFFGSVSSDQDDVFFRSITIGWNRLIDGDVDADGDVDLDDVNTLSYILASDKATSNADVNGDGRITIADITALINLLHK